MDYECPNKFPGPPFAKFDPPTVRVSILSFSLNVKEGRIQTTKNKGEMC